MLRRALIGVVALGVAAALPGVAWGGNGGSYSASLVSTPPTLDGTITGPEWSNATSYNITLTGSGGTFSASARFVHTATDLYVGVVVQDSTAAAHASLSASFDNGNNGTSDAGDDDWNEFLDTGAEDFYYNATVHSYVNDGLGQNQTTAAGARSGGAVTFEIKHPLCSGDTGHDLCVSSGQTVGVNFQYESGNGGFSDGPGASLFDQTTWGALTIASDTTAPTVTWVSPATGGTDLLGITTLSVNAADDVGVDHVTFRYFDGAAFHELGSDSTAPYSVQFNTLAFPDRPTNAGTVYAQSFDAAGNSSTPAGVGVGINNGQSSGDGGGTVHGAIDIDFIFLVTMAPNTSVTGTVSATPGHAASSWSVTTDANGNASVPPAGRWDLVPGTVITADDGHTPKSVTLVPIHISGVNYAANTASGTGPGAGAEVRVTIFSSGGANLGIDSATTDANNNWTVHFTGGRQVAGGQYLIADTPDADQDRTRADFPVAADQWAVSITGTPTSQAGVGSVALTGPGALPPNVITGVPGGPTGTGLGGIGLGGIGLGGIGLGGIGLGGITLDQIGLGGIGLGGIGLGGIGLGGIGLTPVNLTQNGLGGVPLSTIPLKLPDSWQARVQANTAFKGTPVQSITLGQALGTSVVQGVALKDLDISGTALGGIGLGGIGLGGIGLGGIGLGGIADGVGGYYGGSSSASNLAGWCDYINRQPGFSCDPITGPATLAGKTVMDIALQGVGLGGIPFEKIGLGGINLNGTGLGGIPIGTALGGIGLGGIGLGGIDLTGTALGGIALRGINWSPTGLGGIGLGGIALGGIPNKSAILNCPTGAYTCPNTDTLAQAALAGAIKPDATVQDIRYYCVTGSSNPQADWCRSGEKPILMQDFIKNLPPTVTLADLLGSLLPQATFNWEKLPLNGVPLQDFSSDGGVVTYTVTFSLASAGTANGSADVQVTLPEGARYFKGTTTSTATLTQSEPDFDPFQNTVTWHATFATGGPQTLTFKAKPGIELGTEDATAQLVTGFGEGTTVLADGPSPAATSITQTFPTNGAATSPQIVGPDKLYLGYTPNGTDRDYFSLPLPDPGTKVTVHLGHLSVDEDLVVFAPTADPLRVPKPGAATTVAPNVSPDLQQRTQAIQPEALNDVPQAPPAGQSVVGISDNRGLADEEVTFVVPEHAFGAMATIQVTSYDGSYTNDPWTLRVEQSPPLPLPTSCSATPTTNSGATKPLPSSIGGSTLYLFNSKRFGDIYGTTPENDVWNNLTTLASRSDGAGGAVIPIDAVPSIGTALNAWYGHACSPSASNDVVRAIGKYLDTVATSYKYVVVVGGYDVTPPGLVLDNTSYVNEREYASTFYGASNNQYLAAYALGYLPTDDPYGDTNYSGTGAYIPEVPVGRLLETPDQINGQLTRYVTNNGSISPTTALVTGYDFLSDGSQQVANALQSKAPVQLINDTWTRSQLISALFPTAGAAPQIDVINAHYDHQRALPANENSSGTSTDLFQTSDLASTANRLVITLGCHSGVPVSNQLFGLSSPIAPDWAESYLGLNAIGYIANTGFGLGETAGVAYSEQLQVLLAQRLDGSMTVGQALAYAKQEYAGSVPTTSGYQLKVLNEAELYGLPMYQVGAGSPPGTPTPPPVVTDPVTGLAAAPFNVSPTYALVSAGSRGGYYTVNGSAAYEDRRPIEPLSKLDVTEPNLVAHGALLTGLVSTDQMAFDAAFSRPTDDLGALSPELVGNLTYPAKLQAITTFASPAGTRQRLLLFGGQYKSDATPDPFGIGIQRLFTSQSGVVLYAPATTTDFDPPTFGPVSVSSPTASTVSFAADITDNSGVGGVKRVVALYRDESGSWQSIDLSHVAGSTRWSGAGPLTGTSVEWFIQAVDGSGNVGVTSYKAQVKSTTAPANTGSIAATITGPQTNSWFTGAASVTLSGAPDITYSLDGAAFVAGTSFSVTGTGVHTLNFQGSDGSQGFAVVPIDVTPPTISVPSGITASGATPRVVCADAGSGIASCLTTPNPIDLSVGPHTVHVVATDRVGNVTTRDGSYTVDSFTGFLAPVDNPTVVNVAKAGSAIPVKFSLGLNLGLGIIQPGYPLIQSIACDSTAPQDAIEQTVTANSSSLTYDATSNQYSYVWKTNSAWAGTCRQFILRLTDGTEHRANFSFK